tara:strand:+ start:2139 stop:2471 length:333 start_codon:yes stop_codon:yes gene_type:complete
MIDWQRVNELRDEVGAEDFEEVVDLFLEEVEEVTDRLADRADADTLAGDLHFLKGCALSLGFSGFSDLCQRGETLSAQGLAGSVDVPEVLAVYHMSKKVFLKELPNAVRS